jgi:CheY-like chemotaxis protein
MKPCNVLVIEDEAVIAMDLEEKLRKLGHQVVGQGTSGEEAVEQAREKRPDLILMDIRLQRGMDGIDAARTIRQKLDIPVVYLTALSDDATVDRAKLTEPLAYILKPIQERELRVILELALHRHEADTERKRVEEALRASEKRYQERILELEKWEELIVGRELKMMALKKELESLRREVKHLRAASFSRRPIEPPHPTVRPPNPRGDIEPSR